MDLCLAKVVQSAIYHPSVQRISIFNVFNPARSLPLKLVGFPAQTSVSVDCNSSTLTSLSVEGSVLVGREARSEDRDGARQCRCSGYGPWVVVRKLLPLPKDKFLSARLDISFGSFGPYTSARLERLPATIQDKDICPNDRLC
eukprot:scaffold191_cov677-Pavlova_lutheri.AAC.8